MRALDIEPWTLRREMDKGEVAERYRRRSLLVYPAMDHGEENISFGYDVLAC